MSRPLLVYLILGGAAGTLARYGLEGWVQQRLGATTFPAGTLSVNLLGSFALGFVARLATATIVLSPGARAGLTVGFCGAFTTMSTFAYETVSLLSDGDYGRGVVYAGASLLGCLVAVSAGTLLAARLV